MFNLDAILDPKTSETKGTDSVIVYVNKFDEGSAKAFFDDFRRAQEHKQKIVPVFIDSYGGFCDSLLVMIDTMLSFPGKIATITLGKAMSCGSVLLACGDRGMRYAAPNSRIMVHHVASCSWGKTPDMENDTAETKRLQKQIFNLMAKKCGQPAGYFLNLLKTHGNVDLFLTPEKAKMHKIVDYVRNPTVEVETTTKITIK